MRDDLKVGVFLCECGGNISDIINLDKVRASLNFLITESTGVV